MPQAVYVNMSELASLAAARAQLHHQHNASADPTHHDKVCCESSASESSLESSSGYGSQGACEHHASPGSAVATATTPAAHTAHLDVDCEIVTLRREPSAAPADGSALSLASLEEAVRCLSAACDAPAFATIGRARCKPAPPKRRPLSLATPALLGSSGASGAGGWSRRGSSTSLGKPPPPVRRSSSISRPQRPTIGTGGAMVEAELPPPPPFLLQPDNDNSVLASAPGFKLQQEKRYQSNTIYAQPSQIIASFNSVTLARHSAAAAPEREPLSPLALRKNIAARSHSADRRGNPSALHAEQGGLLAALSAKLSPRAPRRAGVAASAAAEGSRARGCHGAGGMAQAAFLDKLSATLQQQQQRRGLDSTRATTVRDIINAHAKPDPRACHSSLMEQIKRGATLRRNRHCNDRSAPHIR